MPDVVVWVRGSASAHAVFDSLARLGYSVTWRGPNNPKSAHHLCVRNALAILPEQLQAHLPTLRLSVQPAGWHSTSTPVLRKT